MSNGTQPVELPLVSSPQEDRLEDTLALCLSGGGFRAMLYHLGVIWYLEDSGYLPKLARISSVSGGSITAAVLALAWGELRRATDRKAAFQRHVVAPVRKMAGTNVDTRAILLGALGPGTVSDRIIARYKDVLFGEHTLQDFPDQPRFVINATNVQTGSLFRFSKPYIGDWQLGRYLTPRRSVAEAVAASSAFPPVLSPVHLEFSAHDFGTDPGPCHRPPFTTKVVLTDGGVYDNMGIETAWKRCRSVLVSDAGGKMQPEEEPHSNWAQHSLRINSLIDNQVRSLRKRQVVWAFRHGFRKGAYWGMWTDPAEYPAASQLSLPKEAAGELARTPTRLRAMPAKLQERLINFGYGMAERAIRSYFDQGALGNLDLELPVVDPRQVDAFPQHLLAHVVGSVHRRQDAVNLLAPVAGEKVVKLAEDPLHLVDRVLAQVTLDLDDEGLAVPRVGVRQHVDLQRAAVLLGARPGSHHVHVETLDQDLRHGRKRQAFRVAAELVPQAPDLLPELPQPPIGLFHLPVGLLHLPVGFLHLPIGFLHQPAGLFLGEDERGDQSSELLIRRGFHVLSGRVLPLLQTFYHGTDSGPPFRPRRGA
jgi:NTE family protein